MNVFMRNIDGLLQEWRQSENRKPLIIRGARQTGKTTAVLRFAKSYPQSIYVNLDRFEDRKLFETERPLGALLDELFFIKKQLKNSETLLFIDEIQNSSRAISSLRYLYEEYPQYHVIAAGSLLEQAVDMTQAFPVGRVSYAYVHPVSFYEFLQALGEPEAAEAYRQVPIPAHVHSKMLALFHTYLVVGGMPEAVQLYAEEHDLFKAAHVYDDLIVSYADDIEKYPVPSAKREVVRHVFNSILTSPMERVTYNGYGYSGYGSVQIKAAFQVLQKAMLCSLEHPLTSTSLPLQPNVRKKPRLHIVDTGLAVHAMGFQTELFSIADLTDARKGSIAEHIVGQELSAASLFNLHRTMFWVREKKQSSAEVDYVVQVQNRLFPVEVKSGSTGRLRSLMRFMDMSPENLAVRLYGGTFDISKVRTIQEGKNFTLLNVPYYHAGKIADYLEKYLLN